MNLRKGIPYLLEAARMLERTSIRFLVAGPLEISARAVASAPSNVTFLGRVLRADAAALYRRADVFVLPTLSDGFAITQLEAMAHGLPVITAPRCDEVVTSGIDGLSSVERRGFRRKHTAGLQGISSDLWLSSSEEMMFQPSRPLFTPL